MLNKLNLASSSSISSASNFSGSPLTSKTSEIEALFGKILSPIKKSADPNLVASFCQLLNNDLDGAQLAIDLIVPKIQSTQEWEALVAFYVRDLFI